MRTMRQFVRLHKAEREDIGDLVTFRVLPSSTVAMGQFEPFLFLNHHGPQVYPPRNYGLPFAPHPHRGFETITIIRKGELLHRDSTGFESVIKTGGIQWMTAGRGIIHEEISPDEFKAKGGEVEILQLWLNLPAALKMTPPAYKGMQKAEIKHIELPGGGGEAQIIAGQFLGEKAHYQSLTGIDLATLSLKAHASLEIPIPDGQRIFFYVVDGQITANGHDMQEHNLAEFDLRSGGLTLHALQDSYAILGVAKPLHEPIYAHGPFVMNTKDEIYQAIMDYQNGKF